MVGAMPTAEGMGEITTIARRLGFLKWLGDREKSLNLQLFESEEIINERNTETTEQR